MQEPLRRSLQADSRADGLYGRQQRSKSTCFGGFSFPRRHSVRTSKAVLHGGRQQSYDLAAAPDLTRCCAEMLFPASQTASSLLLSAKPPHRFSSGCTALDRLITPTYVEPRSQASAINDVAAGLGQGQILELLGPPGIGKTRTAMAFVLEERFRDDGGHVLVVGAQLVRGPDIDCPRSPDTFTCRCRGLAQSSFAPTNSRSPNCSQWR